MNTRQTDCLLNPIHAPTPNPPSSGMNWTVMTFEDDSVRVIPTNLGKAHDLLSDWYNEIEYFVNIESLLLAAPSENSSPLDPSLVTGFKSASHLTNEDYQNVTRQEITTDLKDSFLHRYLPNKLNQLLLNKKVQAYENYVFQTGENAKQAAAVLGPKLHIDNVKHYFCEANEYKPLGTVRPYNSQSLQSLAGTGEKAAETGTSDDYHALVVETFSKKPAITVKIPKSFDTETDGSSASFLPAPGWKPLVGQPATEGWDLAFPSNPNEAPILAFSGWRPGGPYGTQSCSWLGSSNCLSAETTDYLLSPPQELTMEISVFFNLKAMKTLVHVEAACQFHFFEGGEEIDREKERMQEKRKLLDLIVQTPQCGFVRLFHLKNTHDALTQVKELFHNQFHPTVEELNAKIDYFHKKRIETERSCKESQKVALEMEQIKTYLTRYYDINDDLAYKVKASALCQEIGKVLMLETAAIQGLNLRLSNYLKDLGLQKKRYNDGYYYYGLKPIRCMNNPFTSTQR